MKLHSGILLFLLLATSFSHAQKAEHPGYEINSAYEEREPIPTPDGKTLFFWRREMPSNTAGVIDPGDIWFSVRGRNGRWQSATRMNLPLNSKGHDFVWQVSPRNDTLWLMQVPPGVREGGIAYATRNASGGWSVPQPAHIRNFKYQGQYKDYFMSRNRMLFLPNEGSDTYGGTDIYVCFPINDTAWSTPVNLGPDINGYGDEDAPFLAKDGRTLYFNSNGQGGDGDHDIYVSKRLDNSWRSWSKPVPIGAPVNTEGYDFDFFLSEDEQTLYWSSDHSSNGSNDIFYMDLAKCEVDVYPSGDKTLCKGERLVLQGGFTVGNDIRYQWLKNGYPIRNAIKRDLLVTESGQYQLVRARAGCIDTSSVQTIEFVPSPDAHIFTKESILCLDDSIRIEAQSSTGRQFQWQKNKMDIPGANRSNYWVKSPGEYTVKVASGSCATQSAPLNLRRFTPPGIYTAADTVNGLLPILPRWLWTNKVPKKKGSVHIRDMAAAPNGGTYVLSTVEKRGKFYDHIDGFFPEGLFRSHFPETRNSDLSERFLITDPEGNLIMGDNENYLTKFYPDGRLMWRKAVSRQKLTGLASDPLGYIYSMGRFQNTMILAGQTFTPAKRGGMFLAKHSPRGELMWVKVFAVDWFKYEFGNGLHTDCEGNVYIAGGFKLIANFNDQILRAALTGENYFLAKFNPEGEIQWSKRINTDKTRVRSHDVHTDCDGNSYLALNREIFRFDKYGARRWRGKLESPFGSLVLHHRVQSSEGDLFISGYTDKSEVFVTKLNRLHKQAIIWQDRGAANSENDALALAADPEGGVYIAGISKGNSLPGAQFDLTSGSDAFIIKYGKPDLRSKREPLTICGDEDVTLFTQLGVGLRYQWLRNGKNIAGANGSSYIATQPGTYQVRAFADLCDRVSEPQQVTRCGDDPMAAPPITAAPLANGNGGVPPPSTPQTTRPEPKPQPVSRPKAPVAYDAGGTPKRLKNRRVKSQEEISISNPKATIYIWDHAAQDQDTVSVNINGEWIVQEYGLKKKRKAFEFTFSPGNNYIMLYAHNLGGTPPNTASVMVDDGIKQKTLVLRSNLRNCGMLKVRLE